MGSVPKLQQRRKEAMMGMDEATKKMAMEFAQRVSAKVAEIDDRLGLIEKKLDVIATMIKRLQERNP
jgi:hypothetical protein